ncbi:MAG: hypothetical protein ABIB47_02350 [Candidatus Woesearchaeota archaeon]
MIIKLEDITRLQNWRLDQLNVCNEIGVNIRQDLDEDEYKNPEYGEMYCEFIERYQQRTRRQIKTSICKNRWGKWYISIVLVQDSLFDASG